MDTAVEQRGAGRPPKPETITTMRAEIDELQRKLAAQEYRLDVFMEEVSAAMGYPREHFNVLFRDAGK